MGWLDLIDVIVSQFTVNNPVQSNRSRQEENILFLKMTLWHCFCFSLILWHCFCFINFTYSTFKENRPMKASSSISSMSLWSRILERKINNTVTTAQRPLPRRKQKKQRDAVTAITVQNRNRANKHCCRMQL